jgi:GntR family transcriptional regulator
VLTLDDSRPTYLQVADVLRAEIRSGKLPMGERLPSVRDLSSRFEIAPVTTQSALRVLRDEGLIVSRSTRGYFVRDALPAEPTESAEYSMIRDQLTSVQNAMHELAGRISHLEAVVLPPAAADPPGSPQRAPGPDDSAPPSPR